MMWTLLLGVLYATLALIGVCLVVAVGALIHMGWDLGTVILAHLREWSDRRWRS